ncbi:MAG: hypothetical protein ACP5RF_02110 [Candidatus Micrarchaeia archaeon]
MEGTNAENAAMKEREDKHVIALVLLNVFSIVLMLSAIFSVQLLSIAYGTGVGAYIQSAADKMNVTAIMQPAVSELSHIYTSILESYLLFVLAITAEGLAFMLIMRQSVKNRESKRYLYMHAFVIALFMLLYLLISTSFSISNVLFYTVLSVSGIAACFIIDSYLFYELRRPQIARQIRRLAIEIDPSTPYANVLELQDRLFSKLSGNLRIIDKHFNSTSMANLYRLISPYLGNLTAVRIITSKEMLDKGFSNNYNDLKAELAKSNIEIELRIMNDDAAREQHERLMFDNKDAFKIPPLNIINKKSEHVLKMNMRDAKERYEQLYRNSVKFENYYSVSQNSGSVNES